MNHDEQQKITTGTRTTVQSENSIYKVNIVCTPSDAHCVDLKLGPIDPALNRVGISSGLGV